MQIEIDAAEKTQLTIWEIRINLLLEFEIIWIGPLVDQKWARAKHCAIHTRHNCVRIRCGFETRRAVIASSSFRFGGTNTLQRPQRLTLLATVPASTPANNNTNVYAGRTRKQHHGCQ